MLGNIATAALITAVLAATWLALRPKRGPEGFHFGVHHLAVMTALDAIGPMSADQIVAEIANGRPDDSARRFAEVVDILDYCARAGVVEPLPDGHWKITPSGAKARQIVLGDIKRRQEGPSSGDANRAPSE